MTETNLTGAALEVAQKRETQGLNHTLGVHFTKVEPGLVEAEMPITPALLQPFGFLHGGATIALLESVASAGGELACDLETEQPFGVEVTIRHKKSGREGDVAPAWRNSPSANRRRRPATSCTGTWPPTTGTATSSATASSW